MEIAQCLIADEPTQPRKRCDAFNSRSREAIESDSNKFFVSNGCFPQTIDLLKTRSAPMGIGNWLSATQDHRIGGSSVFGALPPVIPARRQGSRLH